MAESPRALLQRTLLARYHELRERLARRFGSAELAADALHDLWRRLEGDIDLPPIAQPEAYLYKAALNTARNLRRAANRHQADMSDIAAMQIADDAPDPAAVAASREAMGALQAALDELTERQRTIFKESFIGDTSQQELAHRFKVSVRTIQYDLRTAVEHCARRLKKKIPFVTDRRGLSGKREGPTS